MPYFEKRGDNYRIVFHLGGKRYRHALKTSDVMLIEQRALHIPEGADVVNFILSGGQVAKPPAVEPAPESVKAKSITFQQLRTNTSKRCPLEPSRKTRSKRSRCTCGIL